MQWSDATYLEDQDHWYHAGLHRSVFLYATPPVHIADVHAVADFDPATGAGRLEVRVGVEADVAAGAAGRRAGWRRGRLADRSVDGGRRASSTRPTGSSNWLMFDGPRPPTWRSTCPTSAPWTAETPALHDLAVTLLDDAGLAGRRGVAAGRLPAGRGASATSCWSTAGRC